MIKKKKIHGEPHDPLKPISIKNRAGMHLKFVWVKRDWGVSRSLSLNSVVPELSHHCNLDVSNITFLCIKLLVAVCVRKIEKKMPPSSEKKQVPLKRKNHKVNLINWDRYKKVWDQVNRMILIVMSIRHVNITSLPFSEMNTCFFFLSGVFSIGLWRERIRTTK